MSNSENQWTEESSQLYQEIASIAVPDRAEQIATMLTLLPFSPEDRFHLVELASGEGILSQAILTAFPKATITALDGSESMRAEAARRFELFGNRAQVSDFDLASSDWYSHLDQADGTLCSLSIHHLDGPGKQALFATICKRLSSRAIFLIADIIAPKRPEASELFAATWDRSARSQSVVKTGSPGRYQKFLKSEWNIFRHPDPFDKPSPLFDQLLWLREAGFAVVDCFWLQAGHAIYGGYKSADAPAGTMSFDRALQIVQNVLAAK